MIQAAHVVNNTIVWVIEVETLQFAIDTHGGTWYDVTGLGVGKRWTTSDNGATWEAPIPPPVPPQFILSGSDWVGRFTDDEWAWLKSQRQATTPAGKKLDRLMDAIRWTNSVDVSSPTMDPFYQWLLDNGIPGGQARIDELRESLD